MPRSTQLSGRGSISGNSWQRFLRGVGANAFGQVITIIIQVVSIPIFIQFWGIDLYGEWLVLFSISSYLVLSDLGFSTAAANEMTLRISQGKYEEALTIFQSTWLLISTVSATCILLVSAIIWWLPLSQWLNFSHISSPNAAGVILLMILQVFMFQQVALSVAGYQCEGNYASGMLYLHLVRLLEFVAIAIAVSLGMKPLGVALVYAGTTTIGALLMGISLQHRNPWITYGYKHVSRKALKELSLPAIAFMGFPLASILSTQGIILMIGALLSPAAVVIFSTQRTLSRLAWQILNLITNSVMPELSIAFGQKDLTLARKLHRSACKAALWLALLSVSGLALSGPWIIDIWTHGRVSFDAKLFHIMLAIIVVNSLWSTSQAVLMAVNQHQQIALRYVIGSGVAILLALQLTPIWGMYGAAASLLAIDIAMFFYVIKESLRLLNENSSKFIKEIIVPPHNIKTLLNQLRN
jgi:O-antigen/teichoic acid export membrane protein